MMKLNLFLVRKLNEYMFNDIFYTRVSNSSHHPLIWVLKVNRLQSYRLSNFETDLNLGRVEPGSNVITQTLDAMAKVADFWGKPSTLTVCSNSVALKPRD